MLCAFAEFKDYIGTTGETRDALIEAALLAAQKEVLDFCQRSSAWTGFEASTGTRSYAQGALLPLEHDGRKGTVLWLGNADLHSVDTLTNGDGTVIPSTDYWLGPRDQRPYRYIRLKSNVSWNFDTDRDITVAGTWCHTTAADDKVKEAVKETGKYLLDLRASQTHDVTAMPEIGQIAIPKGMPVHVKVALSHGGYKRTRGAY